MVETQRKLVYSVIGIFLIVGCITLIITLIILLTRRHECYLGATDIHITGFQFEAVEEGIRVTWQQPPEMLECNPGYEVIYNSTMGEFYTNTKTESVIIPDDTFCYYFGIKVIPLTTLSPNSFGDAMYYETRDTDVEFSVESNVSPSTMVVTWTHPNQKFCSLAYKVEYQSSDGKQTLNVTNPTATFNFVYCTTSTLTIWPINSLDGSFFPIVIDIDATQYPQKIEPVRRTNTTAWIDRRETYWEPVAPIGTCNITYQVAFITDIDTTTVETEEARFEIHRSSFCYSVDVTVYAVAGRSVVQVLKYSPFWTVEMDNVNDLELVLSEDSNTMTAKWSDDPLKEQCNLKYQVTIQRGTSGVIFPITLSTIPFNVIYCVNTTVNVKTIFLAKTSKGVTATYPEVNPTSLDRVDNVLITTENTTAFISWEVPESLQKCSNLFTVTAINGDVVVENQCQEATNCEISLSSFCPYTDFTIRPTSPIDGEVVERRYSCTENGFV